MEDEMGKNRRLLNSKLSQKSAMYPISKHENNFVMNK